MSRLKVMVPHYFDLPNDFESMTDDQFETWAAARVRDALSESAVIDEGAEWDVMA